MENLCAIADTIFESDYWTAVGAVFTALASIGVILVIRQLRFVAWSQMQDLFTKPDFVKNRGIIFGRLDHPDSNQPWTDEQKEAAMEVCRRMDEFARLVPYLAIFPCKAKGIALKVWDDPVGKSWAIVKEIVKKEQDRCNWDYKWKAFEDLGEQAFKRLLREKRDERLEIFVE